MKERRPWVGVFQCLAASFLWGACFLFQKEGARLDIGPILFTCLRLCIGTTLLVPFLLWCSDPTEDTTSKVAQNEWKPLLKNRESPYYGSAYAQSEYIASDDSANFRGQSELDLTIDKSNTVTTTNTIELSVWEQLGYIVTTGLAIGCGSCLQQKGIETTSISVAGFLTGFYIVLVPIAGSLFLQHRITALHWVMTCISLTGVYLLVVQPGTHSETFIHIGSLYVLSAACCFAIDVLVVDTAVKRGMNPGLVTAGSFITGTITTMTAFIWLEGMNSFDWDLVLAAKVPIIMVALLEATGYVLSAYGQAHIDAVHAGVMMALESPFASLWAVTLLREMPSAREWIGCALMFGAALLTSVAESCSAE